MIDSGTFLLHDGMPESRDRLKWLVVFLSPQAEGLLFLPGKILKELHVERAEGQQHPEPGCDWPWWEQWGQLMLSLFLQFDDVIEGGIECSEDL